MATSNSLNLGLSGASGTVSFAGTDSPAFTTPNIGIASATSVNKITITAPATSGTLTIAQGSSLITSGANSLTLTTTGATNVTLPTSGTITAGQSANAWVRFDASTGTPTVGDSLNLSSITDTGVGIYTLNWSITMANANYAILGTSRMNTASVTTMGFIGVNGTTTTTTAIQVADGNNAAYDVAFNSIAIMGD